MIKNDRKMIKLMKWKGKPWKSRKLEENDKKWLKNDKKWLKNDKIDEMKGETLEIKKTGGKRKKIDKKTINTW